MDYKSAKHAVDTLRVNSVRQKAENVRSMDLRLTNLNESTLTRIVSNCHWPFLFSIDCSNTRLTDRCGEVFKELEIRELYAGGNYFSDKLL